MSKFDILDFYRFPGAILVMLAHYVVVYFPIDFGLRQYILQALQPVMGLFFSLSGFVIMHVYDGRITSWAKYQDYLQKRIARIYPLFVVTFAAAWVWGRLTAGHEGMFPTSAILPNLLLIHAWGTTHRMTFDYPSWSISAEIFVYILFPAFLLAVNRLKGLAVVLPLIMAVAVFSVFDGFDLGDWTDATFNFGCLRAAPSFVAGMVVHRLLKTSLAGLRVPAWLAHGLAIAAVPLMLAGAPGGLMLVYMAGLVLVLVAAEPDGASMVFRPWARALANASFGIYLIHALIAPIVLGALPRWFGWPATSIYLLAPVAMVVTTILALASFRYLEDPARRWLGNVSLGAIAGRPPAPKRVQAAITPGDSNQDRKTPAASA